MVPDTGHSRAYKFSFFIGFFAFAQRHIHPHTTTRVVRQQPVTSESHKAACLQALASRCPYFRFRRQSPEAKQVRTPVLRRVSCAADYSGLRMV